MKTLTEINIIYNKENPTDEIQAVIQRFKNSSGKIEYDTEFFHYSGNEESEKKKKEQVTMKLKNLIGKNVKVPVNFYSSADVKKNKRLCKEIRNQYRKIARHITFSIVLSALFFCPTIILIPGLPINYLLTLTFLLSYQGLVILPTVIKTKELLEYTNVFYSQSQVQNLILGLSASILSFLMPTTAYKIRNSCKMDAVSKIEDGEYSSSEIEEKIDNLFETIEKNEGISQEESQYLQNLRCYYLENPYIDYQELNEKFKNLKISREDNRVWTWQDLISKFEKKETVMIGKIKDDSLYYNAVNLSGSLPFRFLNYGVTELITEEYLEKSNLEETDSTYCATMFTKILIELVGSDSVLKSYSERNMGAINEKLDEIYPEKKQREELYHVMEKIDYTFFLLDKIDTSTKEGKTRYRELRDIEQETYNQLLWSINPYVHEKFGVSLKSIPEDQEKWKPCQIYAKNIESVDSRKTNQQNQENTIQYIKK